MFRWKKITAKFNDNRYLRKQVTIFIFEFCSVIGITDQFGITAHGDDAVFYDTYECDNFIQKYDVFE